MSDDDARAGRFAQTYMVNAAYTQLVGLCRGILADSQLTDSEIVTIDQWLAEYQGLLPEWPGQVLARRVKAVLADGLVEDDERADLLAFLEEAAAVKGIERFDAPTTLPLTQPPPHVEYERRAFCLTGTFLYGPRKKVVAAIREWGGRVVDYPNQADYLVIGGTVTPSWKFGTHGLKIEQAVELVEAGRSIWIISEAHWSTSLC